MIVTRLVVMLVALLMLGGCGVLPERAPAPRVYDFGPGVGSPAFTTAAFPADLVIAPVQAMPWLEGTGIHYRFLFDQPQQVRSYARSRWVAPPPALIGERLRDAVATGAGAEPIPGQVSEQEPAELRLRLERFEQVFDTMGRARAVLRVHATLVAPDSDQVLASRVFEYDRVTPTAEASGAVQALSSLTGTLTQDLARWIQDERATIPRS